MAEVIPQINIDGTKIKDTWTEKEYVTDKVYNALNKTVIDLKNNNNLLDSNSILFREEYNSSSKNLNNAIHQGVYSFTNSAVNAPSGVNGGNLLVTNTSKTNQGSSIITQIAFCHNGAVYARTKNASENFTSWNKLAYITDNVASATKATQDSDGNAINTTYVKKVNGTANGLTCADDTLGGQLTVKRNSESAATIKFTNASNVNRYVGFTSSNKIMYRWGDSGAEMTAFLDASNYNDYAPTKTGGGASGTWRINITGNAGTATKATQDKNGRDITGYLYKTENLSLNSNTSIVTNGNITEILNAFCTKFKNIQGTGSYGENPPTSIKSLNDNKAPKVSPAFTGTPTAPTPSTSDNSTKIATTAFVKSLFTASKETNGWYKEASTGFIWQWGQEAKFYDIASKTTKKITFPISFPNTCLCVVPYMFSGYMPCVVGIRSCDESSVIIAWEEWGHDTQSVKAGFLAIGY